MVGQNINHAYMIWIYSSFIEAHLKPNFSLSLSLEAPLKPNLSLSLCLSLKALVFPKFWGGGVYNLRFTTSLWGLNSFVGKTALPKTTVIANCKLTGVKRETNNRHSTWLTLLSQKKYCSSGDVTYKWRRVNVDATWWRIDVDTTSFWHHMPTGIIFPLNITGKEKWLSGITGEYRNAIWLICIKIMLIIPPFFIL